MQCHRFCRVEEKNGWKKRMKWGQMVGARATSIHLRRVFAGLHGNRSPLFFLPGSIVCLCVGCKGGAAAAFRKSGEGFESIAHWRMKENPGDYSRSWNDSIPALPCERWGGGNNKRESGIVEEQK